MKKKVFLIVTAISLLWFSLFPGYLSAQDEGMGQKPVSCVVGKQYLLVIAIDRYQHWNPLTNAVRDAREIKEILINRYYMDYVIELYDEQATYENIRRCFIELQGSLKVDDSLLILYSGHGHLEKSSDAGYLIPVDGARDTMALCLTNSVLKGLIDNIPSKHILLISDSCFSGDFLNSTRGEETTYPKIDIKNVCNVYSLRCRQAIAAGPEVVFDKSEFAAGLKAVLNENNKFFLEAGALYYALRSKVRLTIPLFGDIKGTVYDSGSDFLFFLKKDEDWWKKWQEEFQEAVNEAIKKDGDSSIQAREKIKTWKKVLEDFSYNNPFSSEDEKLRDYIKGRIEYWEKVEYCNTSYNLALKQFNKKQYKEAYDNLKEAKDCDAFQPEVEELKRKIQEKRDDLVYEKSKKANTIEAFLAYLQDFPGGKHRAEAHFNCGTLYLKESNYKEAQDHFAEAVKESDRDAEAHNSLGICFQHSGDYEGAIKEYNTAINLYNAKLKEDKRIARKLAIVYNNLGSSQFQIGKKEEALQNYNEALKLDNKYGNAYYNLGLYYLDKKNYLEAKKKFQIVLKYNKKDTEARKLLEEAEKKEKEKAEVQNVDKEK